MFGGQASIENLLQFVDSFKVRFELRCKLLMCFAFSLILAGRKAPDKPGLHRLAKVRLFLRLARGRVRICRCQCCGIRRPTGIILWTVCRQSVAVEAIGVDTIDCSFHVRAVGISMLWKCFAAQLVRRF